MRRCERSPACNKRASEMIHSGNLLKGMAGTTGLEPATSAVTGQRSNQLNYVPQLSPNALHSTHRF